MQDEMNDLQYTTEADPDIVKVVRCKDCQYCVKPFLFGKQYYQCEKRFESYGIDIFVEPDDYCSYGERKDELH